MNYEPFYKEGILCDMCHVDVARWEYQSGEDISYICDECLDFLVEEGGEYVR